MPATAEHLSRKRSLWLIDRAREHWQASVASHLPCAFPTAAIGLEFDAIAAVAVGGTTFDRGNGCLPGTVLGVLAVGVLRNGLNLVGVQSSVQVAAIGVLVLVVLLIESMKGKGGKA